MRNKEKEEPALVNIERNPLIIIVSLVISAAFIYQALQLFRVMNPWGFMVMAPAALFSFQTLWLLLNPFARVFKDRIEIRQSFFHHKDHYFIDIKRIAKNKKGMLYITYHDDEIERIKLFGIKAGHIDLFKSEVEKQIAGAGTRV